MRDLQSAILKAGYEYSCSFVGTIKDVAGIAAGIAKGPSGCRYAASEWHTVDGSSYDYDIGRERFSDSTMEQQGVTVEDWVQGTHSPNNGRQLDIENPLYPCIIQMRAGMF